MSRVLSKTKKKINNGSTIAQRRYWRTYISGGVGPIHWHLRSSIDTSPAPHCPKACSRSRQPQRAYANPNLPQVCEKSDLTLKTSWSAILTTVEHSQYRIPGTYPIDRQLSYQHFPRGIPHSGTTNIRNGCWRRRTSFLRLSYATLLVPKLQYDKRSRFTSFSLRHNSYSVKQRSHLASNLLAVPPFSEIYGRRPIPLTHFYRNERGTYNSRPASVAASPFWSSKLQSCQYASITRATRVTVTGSTQNHADSLLSPQQY